MRRPNKRPVFRSLSRIHFLFGFALALFMPQISILLGDTSSWGSSITISDKASSAPSYLGALVPEPTTYDIARHYRANGQVNNTIGILSHDVITYGYGETADFWKTDKTALPTWLYIHQYRFGWPFRSVYFDDIQLSIERDHVSNAYLRDARAIASFRMGIKKPAWLKLKRAARQIPIAPIWSGFLFNIIFYSLCSLFISWGWLLVRTRNRRAKGLCVYCAYKLEGLDVCPECGSDHAACSPD